MKHTELLQSIKDSEKECKHEFEYFGNDSGGYEKCLICGIRRNFED